MSYSRSRMSTTANDNNKCISHVLRPCLQCCVYRDGWLWKQGRTSAKGGGETQLLEPTQTNEDTSHPGVSVRRIAGKIPDSEICEFECSDSSILVPCEEADSTVTTLSWLFHRGAQCLMPPPLFPPSTLSFSSLLPSIIHHLPLISSDFLSVSLPIPGPLPSSAPLLWL